MHVNQNTYLLGMNPAHLSPLLASVLLIRSCWRY